MFSSLHIPDQTLYPVSREKKRQEACASLNTAFLSLHKNATTLTIN